MTLSAPKTAGGNIFASWSGCTTVSTVNCTVVMNTNKTVTANYSTPLLITPMVTVTPSASSITTVEALTVTVAVSGGSGNPAPTGSVTVTNGSYISAAVTLTGGGASIYIPAGSLATGNNTLTVNYTPDAASTAIYCSANLHAYGQFDQPFEWRFDHC